MNHNLTLYIAVIVAAVALTAVAFTIPQQALAHYGHHIHNNSVKTDQQTNQANFCSIAICLNNGTTTVEIER